LRTCEKLNNDQWVKVDFSTLKNGDIFRQYDDGKRYIDENTRDNVWVAKSNAYINNIGVWVIETLN